MCYEQNKVHSVRVQVCVSRAAGGRHCRVPVRDSVSEKPSADDSPAISCASSGFLGFGIRNCAEGMSLGRQSCFLSGNVLFAVRKRVLGAFDALKNSAARREMFLADSLIHS